MTPEKRAELRSLAKTIRDEAERIVTDADELEWLLTTGPSADESKVHCSMTSLYVSALEDKIEAFRAREAKP